MSKNDELLGLVLSHLPAKLKSDDGAAAAGNQHHLVLDVIKISLVLTWMGSLPSKSSTATSFRSLTVTSPDTS